MSGFYLNLSLCVYDSEWLRYSDRNIYQGPDVFYTEPLSRLLALIPPSNP